MESLEAMQEGEVDRTKADQLKHTRKASHEWMEHTERLVFEMYLIC